MAVQWRENRAGVRALFASPAMVEAMRSRAERGMHEAIRISPVDTGRYKASFVLLAGLRNGRAWARYENGARNPRGGFMYSRALEFGTRFMKRQRILARSIDAMRF